MTSSAIPSATSISRASFDALLAQYPALLQSLATSSNRPGQTTLQELDTFRYETAPQSFGISQGPCMALADVQKLVDWKLRHGKYRPRLAALVASNPAPLLSQTIRAAIDRYRASPKPEPSIALTALSALRGIGPATASLLLAVHDPPRRIFFSDEAFRWLCCDGRADAPIRYVAAEYAKLSEAASALGVRLGVAPTEVEKVAYVLLKRPAGKDVDGKTGKGKALSKDEIGTPRSAKRKANPERDATDSRTKDVKPEAAAGARRSKRLKSR